MKRERHARPADRYAVIGDPVAHSVSPPMQRAAFAHAGIDADYVARRVRAEDLPSAMPLLREEFAGLNVTRPLKEAVAGLVDALSPSAAAGGSVNTIVLRDGRATGESTDGVGFLAALARVHSTPIGRALVLGTGGATRAVAAALAAGGTHVQILGRNEAAGLRLAEDLTRRLAPPQAAAAGRIEYAGSQVPALLPGADLVVNATPLGDPSMPGASPVPIEAPLESVEPKPVVFDLIYRPRRTPLLRRAADAGCPVVEGVEMLIEQGARSFELWTGLDAPLEVMRAAAYAALADDAGPDRPGAPARLPVRASDGG